MKVEKVYYVAHGPINLLCKERSIKKNKEVIEMVVRSRLVMCNTSSNYEHHIKLTPIKNHQYPCGFFDLKFGATVIDCRALFDVTVVAVEAQACGPSGHRTACISYSYRYGNHPWCVDLDSLQGIRCQKSH